MPGLKALLRQADEMVASMARGTVPELRRISSRSQVPARMRCAHVHACVVRMCMHVLCACACMCVATRTVPELRRISSRSQVPARAHVHARVHMRMHHVVYILTTWSIYAPRGLHTRHVVYIHTQYVVYVYIHLIYIRTVRRAAPHPLSLRSRCSLAILATAQGTCAISIILVARAPTAACLRCSSI